MKNFPSDKLNAWGNISILKLKREIKLKQILKRIFTNYSNAFYGKTMENVRNRIKIETNEKLDNEKNNKQHSELTFNGIRKSFTNYGSYTFEQNNVLMDKPIYLGFAVLEIGNSLMDET